MRLYLQKIAELIRDHTFITASLAIVIAVVGGAYGLGLKISDNHQRFLEDRMLDLQERLDTSKRERAFLENQIAAMNAEYNDRKSRIDNELRTSSELASSLKKSLQMSKAKIDKLSQKAVELQTKYEIAQRDAASRANEVKRINEIASNLYKINESLDNKYREISDIIQKRDSYISELESGRTLKIDNLTKSLVGDIVSIITGDEKWKRHYKLEDTSETSNEKIRFGKYVYEIRNGAIYHVGDKSRPIAEGNPEIYVDKDNICYGYFAILDDSRFKLNKTCHVGKLVNMRYVAN